MSGAILVASRRFAIRLFRNNHRYSGPWCSIGGSTWYYRASNFHTCQCICSAEGKSLVEQATNRLKDKQRVSPGQPTEDLVVPKPPLLQRIWEGIKHTVTGFRLFATDVRLSTKLLIKSSRGEQLSRRERKLFRRTVGDIFRILPFSVFIIVPFMEFLLPVYLFFFPGMLPTSFQRQVDKDARKKGELRVKLQMAQFLQETMEDMALSSKQRKRGTAVQEFSDFFQKIRTSGMQASTEDIIKFSKLFEDELTLDNLSRPQIVALSKLLLLPPYATTTFLRFQLRMKLRQLEADDKLIQRDGIESLTVAELQGASQARGMRALGLAEERLKFQLQQWLDLHLNLEVPASLLLLSRAMYLPDSIGTQEALKSTLSALPEAIVEEAEIKMADVEGEVIDNQARLEVLRQQETLIKEEKLEQESQEEQLVEEASLTREDVRHLSQAVTSLKSIKEGDLEEEKASLEELMEERKEYTEDVADLATVQCQSEDDGEQLMESKASARLGRRVDGLIAQVESTLHSITIGETKMEDEVVVTTEELGEVLAAIKQATSKEKVKQICEVLDKDHDGNISLDELTKVVELIGVEDVGLSADQVTQVIELLKTEHTTPTE